MVSKNTIKRITSLSQKKYRHREGVFVAEGIKVITELLNSQLKLDRLYTVDSNAFAKMSSHQNKSAIEQVSEKELQKISFLKTAQKAVATFYIPEETTIKNEGLTLVLDDVRDPGNLGTIIRLCDWFGVKQLVCSPSTVDCYNPKVVQATMGSLTRVEVIYTDLLSYLENEERPVHGTFMDGENIYDSLMPSAGVYVMGNEANGISKEIEELCIKRVAIPRFGDTQEIESLNVATATSIILSECVRNTFIEK